MPITPAILATLMLVPAVQATEPAPPRQARDHRLVAVRAERPVTVDGLLDEPDWARADVATDFTQSEPLEGQPSSERTEVRVLYDDQTIYVGVFAHHRNAAEIVVNELRKDFDGSNTDYFAVIFDTFHDRRNGYQFGVNPRGARWDSQKFNEGRDRNLSWDGAWSVRTRIVADGWYAEYAIPLRTLQFPARSEQVWGVNFVRHLQGRLEDSFWAPVPRQYFVDRLSLAGTLEGLSGIHAGRNVRVKPYLTSHALRGAGVNADYRGDAGVDLKYGLTSSLAADLTVNTDFSEVEADEQQLASSRFSLFFPEKREFFLENAGVFQFGPANDRAERLSPAEGTSAGGRDNSVNNDLRLLFTRRIGLSPVGDAIPVLGGARVSGRVGNLTIGALDVQQQAQGGQPRANMAAMRLRQQFAGGSDVGVMVLDTRWQGGPENRVAGADANVRMLRNLSLHGYAAASTGGADSAGRRDAWSAGASWRDGRWEADVSQGRIGSRFTDDLGFVPRSGVERRQLLLGRHLRPRGGAGWIRDIYPAFGVTDVRREGGGFDSRYWELRLPLTFASGATIEVGANPNTERLTEAFVVNARRNVAVAPGEYSFTDRFVSVASSKARRLAFEGRASTGDWYDGHRSVTSLRAYGRLDVHLSGSVAVTRDRVELPSGEATTTLLTARASYGFSTGFFVNGIVQYNSDYETWNTNIRLNFIHHPLSDVFLVLNTRQGTPLGAPGERSVAVKVTHLVAF